MALTSVKIAVLAPMPRASESRAIEVKPGDLRSWRRPNLMSCTRYSSHSVPRLRGFRGSPL